MHPAARLRALPRAPLLPALGLLLLLLPAAGALRAQAGAPDARPTVAVLYFTNAAMVEREQYAPLAKGLAEMLITELAGNPGIRVVERARLQEALSEQDLAAGGRVDPSTAARIGKVLGARHLLLGSFVVDGRQAMRMDVRAINTETAELEYATSARDKADRMLDLVVTLAGQLNAGLRLPPMPPAAPPAPGIGSKGPNHLRSMLLLSRALEEQDRKNVAAAVALMKESLVANPENARARVLLASLEGGPR